TILKDRTSQEVAYFIYEMNDAEFVVFDLRDSVEVYMDKHETSARQHEIAGVIQGSLYESFQAQGLEISLAKLLEEVFAWSVDFFHLEDGDGFKVIYEEQFVDGISIGISQILAAQIVHEDTIYDAFHFDGDSLGDYFDRNGIALRRQFLQSPVSYHTYGEAASASEFPSRQSRLSLDFGAPQHTPVLAMGEGTVSKIRRQRGHLNSVSVSHEGGFQTQYMHLSKIDPELQEGQALLPGDEIGYVGSPRGSSTHVRLRFWKNGRQVHPNQVVFPSILQLPEDQFPQFQRQVTRYQDQLSRLQLEESLLNSLGATN
ncbi:MAG: peptidoglycan DD-metalloendopeptidase family protein, partial [Bacteroidota bacterium]